MQDSLENQLTNGMGKYKIGYNFVSPRTGNLSKVIRYKDFPALLAWHCWRPMRGRMPIAEETTPNGRKKKWVVDYVLYGVCPRCGTGRSILADYD